MIDNTAFAISAISICFAAAAFWQSHEKLRLDLYNRRFDIYTRVLDFYQLLEGWKPTDAERASHDLQNPDLKQAQRTFIKATREAGFLFGPDSGVQRRLEQMHADTSAVIGFKLNIAQSPDFQGPEFMPQYNAFIERSQRIRDSIEPLEKEMSEHLNFHALSAWRWPFTRKSR